MTVCDLRDTADASAEEKTVSRADGTAVGRGRQVPELPTGGGRECRQKTAWGAACDLRLGKSEIGSSWLFGMGCPSASICAHPHPAPSTLLDPPPPTRRRRRPTCNVPSEGCVERTASSRKECTHGWLRGTRSLDPSNTRPDASGWLHASRALWLRSRPPRVCAREIRARIAPRRGTDDGVFFCREDERRQNRSHVCFPGARTHTLSTRRR